MRLDHPRENEFVQHNISCESWTGANDRAVEKRWIWQTGSDVFSSASTASLNYYTNWHREEPSDSHGHEDCGAITTNGKWADQNCIALKGYVCEQEQDLCAQSAWKTQPGQCGCSAADLDRDSDGVSDCLDGCPGDSNTATAGACGCPSTPAAARTACSDGLCAANTQCDGAGMCGDPQACLAPPCSYGARGNSEYAFCHEPKTMQQARAQCQKLGMDLVAIESQAEDTFLFRKANHLFGRHWTGASTSLTGTWAWISTGKTFSSNGAPVNGSYQNWLPTQPSLAIGMCSTRDDLTGKWSTMPCGSLAGYICEIVDECPMDSAKRKPGACGCGRPDSDADHNGTVDCKSLAGFNDDPGIDPCLLDVGLRAQTDMTMAARAFMDKVLTLADYQAITHDRTRKNDAIFASSTLCHDILTGDQDGDLVPNSIDKCPDTPPLTPTDDSGCTDHARPQVSHDDEVRELVSDFAFVIAKDGVCDTAEARSPEVIGGYINNSQLAPFFAAIFFTMGERACPLRLRIEAVTSDPQGWPIGGARTIYFESGVDDFRGAVSNGKPVDGAQSLFLTESHFGDAYKNLWDQMTDSDGATGNKRAPHPITVRLMALYGDGKQSGWSNAVVLRTIGTR